MKKSSLHHFLINMYGYSFFDALMLLSPVYTIFMQQNGVSDMQISTLLAIWAIGLLLTQFPVTSITRTIGAKNTMFIGQALKAVAFILWFLFPTYLWFAIGMFIWGIQGAIFYSVSEDVLYSELRAHTHENAYSRVLGIWRNAHIAGTALSAAGSLLMFLGYQWITAASVTALAISMLFITRIHLSGADDHTPNDAPIGRTVSDGVRAMFKTPHVFGIMILCVLVTNLSYLNDYLSLIGISIGIPTEYVGAVTLFILACQMLGQGFAHKFESIRRGMLYTFIILAGALFVAFGLWYTIWALALLGLAYAVCAVLKILLYSQFQSVLPDKYRLELLSLYNISDHIAYMMVTMLIGLGSFGGGWRSSVIILGICIILLGIMTYRILHRTPTKLNK